MGISPRPMRGQIFQIPPNPPFSKGEWLSVDLNTEVRNISPTERENTVGMVSLLFLKKGGGESSNSHYGSIAVIPASMPE